MAPFFLFYVGVSRLLQGDFLHSIINIQSIAREGHRTHSSILKVPGIQALYKMNEVDNSTSIKLDEATRQAMTV